MALDGGAIIENLVQLQNVSLKTAQRITCDEEERQRFGYQMVSSYRFPEIRGKLDRHDADATIDGIWVMRISYADATTLFRINLGWANRRDDQPPGFILDLERGYWRRNQADEEDQDDATAGRQARVVPYVTDTKNALVVTLNPTRPPNELVCLQAALKAAIQTHFQLEPRELNAEAMPSARDRREILFYEASEGGAGVLRNLVEDPSIIPVLARKALEICHFDPDTLEDKRVDSCGKACYECLLDYFNQPDHLILDRYIARNILTDLARSECKPAGGVGSRGERMVALRERCDSGLEKKWLDLLDKHVLRPPSDAQYLIEELSTRPDFYYSEYNAAVYIDGPVHDEPDQIRKDEDINNRLKLRGYIVVRFHHKDNWGMVFRQHPDIFGTVSDEN